MNCRESSREKKKNTYKKEDRYTHNEKEKAEQHAICRQTEPWTKTNKITVHRRRAYNNIQ